MVVKWWVYWTQCGRLGILKDIAVFNQNKALSGDFLHVLLFLVENMVNNGTLSESLVDLFWAGKLWAIHVHVKFKENDLIP